MNELLGQNNTQVEDSNSQVEAERIEEYGGAIQVKG